MTTADSQQLTTRVLEVNGQEHMWVLGDATLFLEDGLTIEMRGMDETKRQGKAVLWRALRFSSSVANTTAKPIKCST